ncbi:MAG: hypothetical protein ABIQ88_23075, partial [Chitinophagaceae bacterium]
MKEFLVLLIAIVVHIVAIGQMPTASIIESRLPKGTIVHGNIPYNNDTLQKHLLDIYVPANAKGKL